MQIFEALGSCVLQHKIMLGVGMLAAHVVASSAMAQSIVPFYPGTVASAYVVMLPPYEIDAVLRSVGLEPLSRPLRHGVVYGVRAVDPSGREVQVIADARDGRILRVYPLPPRLAAVAPPPYMRLPGRLAVAPDLSGSRIAVSPEVPSAAGAAPAAGLPGAAPATASRAPAPTATPLPRPRPKVAAVETPAPAPATPPAVAPPGAPPPVPAAPAGAKDEVKRAEQTGTVPAPAAEPPPAEFHE